MSWLGDLLDWWRTQQKPPAPPAPPVAPQFTMGPRPFGVSLAVAGVEWQTDSPSSGRVDYRPVGSTGWTTTADASQQRDHQRTLMPLASGTDYEAQVLAWPAGHTSPTTLGMCTFRTLASPAPTPVPPSTPPPTLPPGTDPIPHEPIVVNVLEHNQPWVAGSLTIIAPDFSAWLLRYCLGGPTTLILADMGQLPDRMRQAGYRGRDNALYYSLSRSYAQWPWHGDPNDPDAHLSDQRDQLYACWANYLDTILGAMRAAPATRAIFLANDGPDRCGDVLSEYSLRQLSPVSDRVDRGEVFHG